MVVVILWLAGMIAVGWLVARWGWRLRSADISLGVAPAVGLASGLLATNALTHLLPVGTAALVSTAVLGAGGLALVTLARRSAAVSDGRALEASDHDAPRPDAVDLVLWLVAGGIVIAVVGAGALATLIYDEELQHWPLVATLAADNFPPSLPFWPAWPAVYHYGSDLLAAAVHRLAGLAVWWSIDVITLVVAAAVFWGVASLLRRAGGSAAYAIAGAVFVFFGGGWVPGWFAQRIPFWLTYSQGPLAGMTSEPMLVGNLFNSFALIVHSHPPALGLVCLLAYAHGWITVQAQGAPRGARWLAAGLTVLVGAAAALASSSEFVLLLLGTGAVVGWRAGGLLMAALRPLGAPASSWGDVARDSALVLATAALGLLSGGALSDLLFRARGLPLGTSLSLRGTPGWPLLTGDVVALNASWWWDLLLAEYGLPILLLPLVLWWCFRHPTPLKTWLLVVAGIGFALPLLLRYGRADYDIARFARTAGYLWLLLCALTAVELSRGRQWSRLAQAVAGVFLLGSIYMGVSFAISLWSPEGLKAQSPDVPEAQEAMAPAVSSRANTAPS